MQFRHMAMMGAIVLLATSAAMAQFTPPKPPASPQAFIADNEAGLEAVDASIAGMKGKKPMFVAALHLAHGSIIAGIPQDVLNAYADGLKEAGVERAEIYTTPLAWPDKIPADIAKYDALIAHMRQIGLKLGFDPTIIQPVPGGYAQFHPWAIAVYTELARRYQPDKFSVLHEPAAMDRRLKEHVAPETWAAFAAEACAAVTAVSPKTECTVAVLPFERAEFAALIKVPAIHSIGFDIYALGKEVDDVNDMVKAARAAGKTVHIAEVGRPAWDGLPTIGLSGKGFEDYNVGDPRFIDVDKQWMETMTRYAAAWQFDSIMWFRSTNFFAYSPPGTDTSLISPGYIQTVAAGVAAHKRTAFFDDYRKVVDSYK